MGVILDSSVLIAAERQGNNARQMLATVSSQLGTEIALPVLTLLELAHGAARADTSERKSLREQFIEELLTALPVHPVTAAIALRTGRIDSEKPSQRRSASTR